MNSGRKVSFRILLLVLALGCFSTLHGQDEVNYEELLQRVDTIENPVYKPMISFGYGILNFFGDVKSSYRSPVMGNPAFRANITTFIDNKHFFALNFFFLAGTLTAEQNSLEYPEQNLNFFANVYGIGATARYDFGHFIPEDMWLRPYVSAGIEQLGFSTKGDLYDANQERYYYWPDGTIRNLPVNVPGAAYELTRDYNYETDLRLFESTNYGLGDYNQRTVGIPVEIGFTMKISQRVNVSVGTEYHISFTDYIDNVASEGTYITGKKGNDGFLFTHATLQFDLFSDPKTRTVDLLYADYEMDAIFYDDEDGDFVLDIADRCPGTPFGVVTDTLGCPLDGDADGVPDYLDKEPDTPAGVWVDDDGVSLDEDAFLESLQRGEALRRDDLEAYMLLMQHNFVEREVKDIPEKYAPLDIDEDGYISFDELLHVIDDYFDFKVNLSLEELREVNEFFFSQ